MIIIQIISVCRVLPAWLGGDSILQVCLHHEAGADHPGAPGRHRADRPDGAGPDVRPPVAVPAPQTVAAIQVEEELQEEDSGDVVAAMVAKKRPNFKQDQQATGKGGKRKGLCWAHQKFGEDYYRCAPGQETRQPGGGGRRLL